MLWDLNGLFLFLIIITMEIYMLEYVQIQGNKPRSPDTGLMLGNDTPSETMSEPIIIQHLLNCSYLTDVSQHWK